MEVFFKNVSNVQIWVFIEIENNCKIYSYFNDILMAGSLLLVRFIVWVIQFKKIDPYVCIEFQIAKYSSSCYYLYVFCMRKIQSEMFKLKN